MRLMIVVTHLLGTGHLSRMLTLGRAFATAGHSVLIASGGRPAPHLLPTPVPGLQLLQLPMLASAGTDFSTLTTAHGTPVTPQDLQHRRDTLLSALHAFAPDVLMTELFPFGRRILAAEFEAVLTAAASMTPRPLILSSVRDILAAPSKPSRIPETERRLLGWYDGVLVHADPDVVRLEASWPLTAAMFPLLHYTGFVAPPLPPLDVVMDGEAADAPPPGTGEILVTAGGGAVGRTLLRTAAQAAGLAASAHSPATRWRLLVGGADAATLIPALSGLAPPECLRVEPVRPDYRVMLQRARAAIAQCGYNTALDCIAAAVPTVFCPMEEGGETEQRIRAEQLAIRPGMTMIRESDLTPDALLRCVTAVMAYPPAPPPPGPDGTAGTVAVTLDLLQRKRS